MRVVVSAIATASYYLILRESSLNAVPGDQVVWWPASLRLYYAGSDHLTLDRIARNPAFERLKNLVLRLDRASADVRAYHKLVFSHPLAGRLSRFTIDCSWQDSHAANAAA